MLSDSLKVRAICSIYLDICEIRNRAEVSKVREKRLRRLWALCTGNAFSCFFEAGIRYDVVDHYELFCGFSHSAQATQDVEAILVAPVMKNPLCSYELGLATLAGKSWR